jgi:hypothetical protein
LPGFLLRYAARLRFPTLFALVFTLFCFDLLVPDVLPFVDEILLGLLSLMLGNLRGPETPSGPDVQGDSSTRSP